MAWEKGFAEERRDTEHDQETFGGTLTALAEAIHALTFPTILLMSPITSNQPPMIESKPTTHRTSNSLPQRPLRQRQGALEQGIATRDRHPGGRVLSDHEWLVSSDH